MRWLRILDQVGRTASIGVELFSKLLDALPPSEVGRRCGAAARAVLAAARTCAGGGRKRGAFRSDKVRSVYSRGYRAHWSTRERLRCGGSLADLARLRDIVADGLRNLRP